MISFVPTNHRARLHGIDMCLPKLLQAVQRSTARHTLVLRPQQAQLVNARPGHVSVSIDGLSADQ